jgi:hypothetical protein
MAEWFSLMDMDDHHVLDGIISHQPSCLTNYFHMIIPVPVDTDMQETRPGAGRYDPIISFVIYTLIYSQLYHYGYVAFTRYSCGKDDVGKAALRLFSTPPVFGQASTFLAHYALIVACD